MKSQKINNIAGFAKKHMRAVAALAFAALVVAAVYSDHVRNNTTQPENSYLYTSSLDKTEIDTPGTNSGGTNTKILGEAALVDGISPEDSPISEITLESEPQDIYFVQAAADRERKRDDAIATLQTVVDSSETMPDAKDVALGEMIRLAANMETEANIETMVKAKGFDDCIAVMSNESVSVIVKTSGLLTHEVAQIREIAMTETGMTAENIKIIEKS